MVKKNYSVTLDKEVVDKAKEKLKVGQKLSPVINELLIKWVGEEGEEDFRWRDTTRLYQ